MDKTTEYLIEDFIDDMLIKHNISLEKTIAYAKEHRAELEGMKRIFKLENADDARFLLSLPALMVPAIADNVVSYFRKEKAGDPVIEATEPDIENCKLPLLSAFIHNPSFFTMAWNWCAMIRQELQARTNPRRSFEVIKGEKAPQFVSKRTGLNIKYQRQAASGADAVVQDGEWDIQRDNVLLGLLWLEITERGTRFVFQFTDYTPEPSCYLVLKYKTKDGEPKSAALREIDSKPDNEGIIICSDLITDFDLSNIYEVEFEDNE
jgi:hypothetical protein